MEKLQGPINPCLVAEDLGVGWLEEFVSSTESYRFEDPYSEEGGDTLYNYALPNLEDKMPFLQMLQGVEPPLQPISTPYPLMQESNFQLLMRLQHQKLMEHQRITCLTSAELESCVTNNNDMIMDLHSPVKSETFREIDAQQIVPLLEPQKLNNDLNQRTKGRSKRTHLPKSSPLGGGGVVASPRERKKRKRSTRPAKNKEEVETQRMTHIAVERNRRRQMNDHLNALRSLMPPSYIQRGDQASIIGGAIDFVKELEQMLQSLQAQKRMRKCEENGDVSATSSTSSSSNLLGKLFMTSPSSPFQLMNPPHSHEEGNVNVNQEEGLKKYNEEFSAENRSDLADIEVVVIQNHVNLKIQCQKRPGQLLKAIVAFEELRLTVLHLNITSLHTLVHYSFNLKIEEDCKVGSADEVARAVHQIFRLINLS